MADGQQQQDPIFGSLGQSLYVEGQALNNAFMGRDNLIRRTREEAGFIDLYNKLPEMEADKEKRRLERREFEDKQIDAITELTTAMGEKGNQDYNNLLKMLMDNQADNHKKQMEYLKGINPLGMERTYTDFDADPGYGKRDAWSPEESPFNGYPTTESLIPEPWKTDAQIQREQISAHKDRLRRARTKYADESDSWMYKFIDNTRNIFGGF